MTPEEIKEEILNTIKPYVNEWMDSSYEEMESDLLDEIKKLGLTDLTDKEKEVLEAYRANWYIC